jgi:hypothetical protein
MGAVTDKVIETIIENRRAFEAFCYSLTPEQLDRPVPESIWIVRDFAAHLGTLDPALGEMFARTTRGEKLTEPDGSAFDIDKFNDALVAERRDWPLEKVFEEASRNREALIDVLRQITDEQTQATMYFGGDAKRKAGNVPFGLFLAGWAHHDPIHVADMLRALPERAEDATLRAWLDSPFVRGYQSAMNPV